MLKIRSQEIREVLLRLVDASKFYAEVSHPTRVGCASVSRWMRCYEATEPLEAKPVGDGQVSLITEERLLVFGRVFKPKLITFWHKKVT